MLKNVDVLELKELKMYNILRSKILYWTQSESLLLEV